MKTQEEDVKSPASDVTTETEELPGQSEPELAERPLPDALRWLICGVLLVSVFGVLTYGYIQQNSVKPPAQTAANGQDCRDPVTENRLRETLKQSPNDFVTLMDWGGYNLTCEKNYPAAVAAYQQALFISTQPNSTIDARERNESQFRLGLAYLYNQNFDEAQGEFKSIIERNPKDTSAMLALAAALQKDKPAEAEVVLKRIIELEPDSPLAKQAQSLLSSLKK
jgi:tetratricopeptide (TPR) repeat protein